MREQLEQYVNLLFAGSPDTEEMKQEILQNTLDRYDDLITQGKSPEAAYRLAISGIGDINEVLNNHGFSPTPISAPLSTPTTAGKDHRKMMRAVAIGMYICCVLPVIILDNVGYGVLGVCLMFLLIAAATVLIIMASKDEGENEEDEKSKQPESPWEKTLNTITLVLFLAVSFATGAWYITWLIWPIMAAIKGIIRACQDLKEANEE